jgi:hypothetical protein
MINKYLVLFYLMLIAAGEATAASIPAVVTGTVTSIVYGKSIVVDGKSYPVLPGPAITAMTAFKPGDTVDLKFNKPHYDYAAMVISVERHVDGR